jgi:peptidoglycan hydrolase CwlO-like protein
LYFKNDHTRSPSPHRNEGGISEVLKENKNLRAEIERLVNNINSLIANSFLFT